MNVYCPTCKVAQPTIPMSYGMSLGDQSLMDAVRRGQVRLGGCSPMPYRVACSVCKLPLLTDDIDWARWVEGGETPQEAQARWVRAAAGQGRRAGGLKPSGPVV